MPDQNIDSLYLDIAADSSNASRSINNLIKKLSALDNQLKGMNSSSLVGLANGLNRFARAASTLNQIKTSDFTRLVKNINSLSSVNAAALNRTASSLNTIARSLSRVGNMSSSFTGISELAKNIGKLGGVNVQRAIANIPRLTKELNNMIVTLARAPQVSNNVVLLTQALAQLATQGGRIKNVTDKTDISFKKLLNGGVIAAVRRIPSLSQVIGKLNADFWMLLRAIKWVGKGIKTMMDYIEDYNYFNVTFGKIGSEWADTFAQYGYESAEAYAESFENRLTQLNDKMSGVTLNSSGLLTQTGMASLGLDISALTAYESNIGAITNALGLTGEISLNTSKALTMLAGDMSSLKNIDLDTVMTNFSSGLIGQSRALYKYGIDITNANLEQYAYQLGLEKSILAMTQAEKMQLRLLAILDQSKVAWGDLANTINSPSNQLRMLENNFRQLGRMIGGFFTPIVSKLLPYLNAVVLALQKLVEWVSIFFGIEIDYNMFGSGYAADSYDDAIEDLEDVAEGYDNAAAAAKDYENTVLSIDQLHKLNSTKESSGGSAGGGVGGGVIDLTDEIAKALEEYESVWDSAYQKMQNKAYDMVKGISDAISKGDFKSVGEAISTGLENALAGINWTKVYYRAITFGQGFANFLNGLITPGLFFELGKTIANSINTALKVVLNFADTLDWTQIGESIASGIDSFFANFNFEEFAEIFNEFVDGIKTILVTTLMNVDWSDVVKGAFDFLKSFEIDTVITLAIAGFGITFAGNALRQLTKDGFLSMLLSGVKKFLGTNAGLEISMAAAGIGTGVMISVGSLLTLAIGGTIFAWNYQNDDDTKELVDNWIANSPLKHTEANLEYGAKIEQTYSMEDALAKQKERIEARQEFVVSIKAKAEDFSEKVEEAWNGVLDFWKDKPILTAISATIDKLEEFLEEKWEDVVDFWEDKPVLTAITTTVANFREFVRNKWNEVVEYWRTKTALSNISTVVNSIRDAIKTKWEEARTWWGNKTGLSSVSATINSIKEALSSKWSDARTWWSNKTGLTAISTTVSSIKDKLKEAWENAKKWFKENAKLNFGITWTTPGKNEAVKQWMSRNMFDGKGWPRLSFYASGGFPTMGELFVANEAGPEMVGKIGTKNAVANQEQITTGIAIAVRTGMFEAMRMASAQNGGGKKVEFVMTIDGKEIGRVAADYNKLNDKKYNVTPSFA